MTLNQPISSDSLTSSTTVSSSPTSTKPRNRHFQSPEKRSTNGSQTPSQSRSLIDLCNQFIKDNNHLGLALISRQRGIPHALRYKIWPILLKYHPYVLNPYLNATVENDSDNEIPINKIHKDILKYFKIRTNKDSKHNNQDTKNNSGGNINNSNNNDNNNNNNNNNNPHITPTSSNGGSPSPSDFNQSLLEEEIIKILEDSIKKFFNKWGAIIKYDSGFTWIALGLAEWFPPIPNTDYVLIGRGNINKNDNLNKHIIQLADIHDLSYDGYDTSDEISDYSSEYSTIIDDHNEQTCNDGILEIDLEKKINKLDNEMNEKFNLDDNKSINSYDFENFNTSMTFAEVYERLVLVLLHSNERSEEKEEEPSNDNNEKYNEKDYGNNDVNDINDNDNNENNKFYNNEDSNSDTRSSISSVKENEEDKGNLSTSRLTINNQEIYFKSGEIEKRIGFFLKAFNKLLPELYKSFSEDDIINNNYKNQWLTWWFKYCGSKVLNKFDRGRLWDLMLGFRLNADIFQQFSPCELNSKTLKAYKKFYNNEILQTGNNFGIEFESDYFWYKPLENSIDLQWSQCDYQYQLVFIFISLLFKNESTLLEFESFEILEFLNNLKKKNQLKFLFGNGFHDINYDNVNISTVFEKIIKDSGELWRNWLWNEIRDEINE
ncbi:hypothetical protein WICMUC_003285 [Wickerhamomyces mucosus]|uniref:Rab-GAP TBC domain-containing protein n=1 Tax=Wickerhamomyces mucosus TaxID=1378264 RepID=A0A9P8TCI1_9ASCO|nr:hypothetical protein WICMUC_003285 [Wickerhamomyces mucosus]